MKLGGRYRGWVSAVAQHPAGDVPAVVLLPHRIVPTRRPASGRGSTIRRDIRARSPASSRTASWGPLPCIAATGTGGINVQVCWVPVLEVWVPR